MKQQRKCPDVPDTCVDSGHNYLQKHDSCVDQSGRVSTRSVWQSHFTHGRVRDGIPEPSQVPSAWPMPFDTVRAVGQLDRLARDFVEACARCLSNRVSCSHAVKLGIPAIIPPMKMGKRQK